MRKISRKSLRRFLKLWSQIQGWSADFHQTLTFATPEFDLAVAKRRLTKLLDNIDHQFPVVSLYTAGLHRTGAIHFHVIFLFFSPVSARAAERFGSAVFNAWDALNDGKCNRRANGFRRAGFHDRLKVIGYVIKDAPLAGDRWWGQHNTKLIRRNSRAVERAEIDSKLEHLGFGRKRRRKPRSNATIPIQDHTIKDVRKLREYIEFHQKIDWESFKRQETGRSGKVSDQAYLEWQNSKGWV